MPKYSAASAYSVCVLWLVLAVASGSRSAWTRGLRCGGAADGSDSVTLHVALRVAPARLAEVRAAFDAVSDPTSSRFRHFLTRDELTAMLGVPETTAERVARFFLEESSVVTVSPHRDALQVTLDCRRAERIFRVRLFRFTHTRSGVAVLRADVSDSTKLAAQPGHALPPDIAPLVRDVQGIHDFPMQRARLYAGGNRPRRQTSKSDTAWNDCNGSCSGNLVPSVIQAQYGLPDHTATSSESKSTTTASSGMAVAEFASNWCQDGLDAIKTACGLSANLTVDRMIGSNGPGICKSRHGGYTCAEAMLDITYIKALASDVQLTDVFQSQHFSIQAWAMEIAQMSDDELPLVHSISFGEDETELPSVGYMQSVNLEFQKLGLRGVSVLVASGDGGVWGRTGSLKNHKFSPDFPASSPYVTAVGGTTLAAAGILGAERAWRNSGGGFSNLFARPAYQDAAVAAYLSSQSKSGTIPDSEYFNRTGRAYPDVSALAGGDNGYCVSVAGRDFNAFTGTSASTPVWASVVARINDLRLARGKAPLGFLNPVLYAHPSAVNDIVEGVNDAGTGIGFQATQGYDPCTGLGTINFTKLSAVLLD